MGRRRAASVGVHQEIQHLAARRSAIDVVAKKKDPAGPSGTLPSVLDCLAMKPKQKIEPAVDVTNDVQTARLRSFRWPMGLPLFQGEQAKHQRPAPLSPTCLCRSNAREILRMISSTVAHTPCMNLSPPNAI